MKCRYCWSDKAYLRNVPGWRGFLFSCALLVPLRCHHCYEKSVVSWFFTIGKQMHPPRLRIAPGTGSTSPSTIARQHSATHQDTHSQNQRRRAA